MHVVISRWGSTGDVMPYVAVGWELARRGAAVTFVGNPYYETRAAEAGLTFVPVGSRADHERLMADADVFDRGRKTPEQVYRDHYYPHMRGFYEATTEAARGGAAIVLAGEAGSATAAEEIGAPLVNIACSPATSRFARSRHDPPHPERVLPSYARWFTRTGTRLGLLYLLNHLRHRRPLGSRGGTGPLTVPADHPIGQLRTSLDMPLTTSYAPDLALCLWPDWFASPQPDWPAQAVVTAFPFYPLPAAITPGTPAERAAAPIIVTTGSLAGAQGRFYEVAVAACVAIGRRAILVSPHRDHVPADLPPEITYQAFAPFAELFARAALVVHHGGVGTASYAIAAGVPQIAMPMRGDQFDNANRLERLGIARMLDGGRTTPGRLAAVMRGLLESRRVDERCRHWQSLTDLHSGLRLAGDAIEALGNRASGRPAVSTA